MNKGLLISAGLLVIAATASSAVKEASPFTVRVGLNSLLGNEAKDFTKASGFGLGVSYDLQCKGFLSPLSKPSVDFDWSRNSGNGNKLSVYGLTYTERMPFSTGDSKMGKGNAVPYGGLGLGLAYTDLDASKTVTIGSTAVVQSVGTKKWNLGGRVLLGVMFEERFSIEAAYHYNGSNDGVKTDSFSLSLGVKF